MLFLKPAQVARWSDAKLAGAIADVNRRMTHYGVTRWEHLPPHEARNALVIRNEWILRNDQLSFDYGSVSS